MNTIRQNIKNLAIMKDLIKTNLLLMSLKASTQTIMNKSIVQNSKLAGLKATRKKSSLRNFPLQNQQTIQLPIKEKHQIRSLGNCLSVILFWGKIWEKESLVWFTKPFIRPLDGYTP